MQVIFESPHELDLEYDDSGLFKRKLVRTPTAFPALHSTGPDDLILADGFSCRTQIAFLGGRRALHLAEVLADRLG